MPSDYFKNITNVSSKEEQAPPPPAEEIKAMKQLAGLAIKNMDEAIVNDMSELIRKSIRHGLDGYLHCLSRLMRHDLAWELVVEAYRKNGEKPPTKYANLFGRDVDGNRLIRPISKWSVG